MFVQQVKDLAIRVMDMITFCHRYGSEFAHKRDPVCNDGHFSKALHWTGYLRFRNCGQSPSTGKATERLRRNYVVSMAIGKLPDLPQPFMAFICCRDLEEFDWSGELTLIVFSAKEILHTYKWFVQEA